MHHAGADTFQLSSLRCPGAGLVTPSLSIYDPVRSTPGGTAEEQSEKSQQILENDMVLPPQNRLSTRRTPPPRSTSTATNSTPTTSTSTPSPKPNCTSSTSSSSSTAGTNKAKNIVLAPRQRLRDCRPPSSDSLSRDGRSKVALLLLGGELEGEELLVPSWSYTQKKGQVDQATRRNVSVRTTRRENVTHHYPRASPAAAAEKRGGGGREHGGWQAYGHIVL
jgi:hypothetical protein